MYDKITADNYNKPSGYDSHSVVLIRVGVILLNSFVYIFAMDRAN